MGNIIDERVENTYGHVDIIGQQNVLENFGKLSIYVGELQETLTSINIPWHH